MQKIDDGFRSLRAQRAPELWEEIVERTPRPSPAASLTRRLAVAALALAIAGTGAWLAARAFLPSEEAVKPAEDPSGPPTLRLGASATFKGAGGGGPLYAFGSVWIPQHREPEEDFILRIDPQTLEMEARIPVPTRPGWEIGNSGFAASIDAVWVVGGTGNTATLTKIDPATNEVVGGVPLRGEFAADVEVYEHALWVSLFEGRGEVSVVQVMDTHVPDVLAPIALEGEWVRDVFAVGNRIVVHTRGGGAVNRLTVIDPMTGNVGATDSIQEAIFTEWDGWIWAGAEDEMLRIDPTTAEVADRYALELYVGHTSIVGGAGGLWFVGYDPNEGADLASTLVRFNPEIGRIDASIDVGGDPVALTLGGGAVWVLSYDGTLTRVDLVRS